MVVRKKGSNSTGKRKYKVKYTKKARQKVRYMTQTELNTKKNISHYFNDKTNG